MSNNFSQDKRTHKFFSYLDLGGSRVYLGTFQTPQEAKNVSQEFKSKFFDPTTNLIDLSTLFPTPSLCGLAWKWSSLKKENPNYKTSFKCFVIQMHNKGLVPKPLNFLPNQIELLFLKGNSENQIAKTLNLSRRSVHNAILSFMDKMGKRTNAYAPYWNEQYLKCINKKSLKDVNLNSINSVESN